MNPLSRAKQFLSKIDSEMQSRAGKTATRADAMASAARDQRLANREKAIMGRGANERAEMLGARLADARRMQESEVASSPVDLRRLMQSAGLSGTGGKGKYTNKGAMQAPDLDEAALRNAVMSAPGGGQQMAQVMAQGEGPGMMEMLQRARAGIAQNMAAEGSRGQLSRGAAGAAITGGITASGAALLDLMQFMTQGANAQQERDDVLPS